MSGSDSVSKDRYGRIVAQIAKFPVMKAGASYSRVTRKKVSLTTLLSIPKFRWPDPPASVRRKTAACAAECGKDLLNASTTRSDKFVGAAYSGKRSVSCVSSSWDGKPLNSRSGHLRYVVRTRPG